MRELTRLITLVFALFTLLSSVDARADLIKQGGTYNRTVLMTATSDHITGATGLTLAVKIAKAGGAFAAITPTVTEQGNGRYSIALVAANLDTLGALDLQVTAAGADPSDTHDQVVAFDPNDAQALGLSSVTGIKAKTDLLPTWPANFGLLGINGTGQFTAPTLALAPTGSGGGAAVDPFAAVTSTAYAAGTFGSLFKTSLANPVPLPGDFVTALLATHRWQNLEAAQVGALANNPATGVATFTRFDGTTFSVPVTLDSQGRITSRPAASQ